MSSLVRFLSVSTAFFSLSLVCSAWLFLFTSLPLNPLAQALRESGLIVEGPSGSIARGLQIRRISWRTPHADLVFEGVRIRMGTLGEIISNKRLSVLAIESRQSQLVWQRPVLPSLTASQPLRSLASTLPALPLNLIQAIQVTRLQLNDVKLITPDLPAFHFERWELKGFVSQGGQSFAQNLDAIGREISVHAAKVSLSRDGQLIFGETARGWVRPPLSPLLRQPLSVEWKGAWNGKATQLRISTFDRRLNAQWSRDGSILMSVKDLTPAAYLNTKLPISKIELHTSVARFEQIANGPTVRGHFWLRNRLFNIQPQPPIDGRWLAVHENNGRRFELRLTSENLRTLKGPIDMSSNIAPDLKEALSRLYFDRPLSQLQPGHKRYIDYDVQFFSYLPSTAPTQPERQPAKMDSRPGLAPDGRPLSLPSYRRPQG